MLLFKCKRVKHSSALTQDIYDELVRFIVFSALQCPCGHVGFHLHGTYERKVKLAAIVLHLIVQRIKCPECGKTHAVLPDILIPWSQVPLDTTVQLVRAANAGELREILTENENIMEEDAHNVRLRFRIYWQERMKSFRIQYDSDLTDRCYTLFKRQFMQIRCGCLLRPDLSHTG